jgi:hypothetical protein
MATMRISMKDSDTRMSDTRMSMADSMRVDEDLDGGLHEDRRESVDILADDLRSAIDGAKTCRCV